MNPTIAFYVMVWVYALPGMPGAPTIEAQWSFTETWASQAECDAVALQMQALVPNELWTLEPRADETTYSRFVCVPVPGVDPRG